MPCIASAPEYSTVEISDALLKMKKVKNNAKNENQLQVFIFTLVSDSQKLQPKYRQKTLKKVKFSISKLIRTNLFMDFEKTNFFVTKIARNATKQCTTIHTSI